MHDIWNPWHGCVKCSEGCAHCYMYFLDSQRGHNGAEIYRTKTGFHYPLSRDRAGNYKVKSGEQLRVCMTSDFFLEQADPWRREAWEIMDQRRDISFFLLTKRPERVEKCLPYNWGGGWEHIFFNVTCENQRRADERIPILHSLPFKHKGIMISEPTIVVVDAGNERKVRAVGDDAKIMLGRTTEGVMAVRPMREGVITDFDMTEIMIQYFMRKAIGSSYLVKPRLFLSYPCSISAIERRAVGEAAFETVSIMTGPEGGFSEDEVRLAQEAGMQICTLGPRILRCETAPLCALSAVLYAAGALD